MAIRWSCAGIGTGSVEFGGHRLEGKSRSISFKKKNTQVARLSYDKRFGHLEIIWTCNCSRVVGDVPGHHAALVTTLHWSPCCTGHHAVLILWLISLLDVFSSRPRVCCFSPVCLREICWFSLHTLNPLNLHSVLAGSKMWPQLQSLRWKTWQAEKPRSPLCFKNGESMELLSRLNENMLWYYYVPGTGAMTWGSLYHITEAKTKQKPNDIR